MLRSNLAKILTSRPHFGRASGQNFWGGGGGGGQNIPWPSHSDFWGGMAPLAPPPPPPSSATPGKHHIKILPLPLETRNILLLLRCIGPIQGRAVGVVAGATRAFGRRAQGVWGRAPQPPEASSAVFKL